MFEKEAEEKYCKGCKSRIEQCLWAWRNTNGLNELKNCSCKEVPNYIRGAIDGYNKANEWHYVKDELPISDKDKFYFVVDKWNEPMIARFYEGVWSNYSTIKDVIAWKEIVLPKEIKENDL